MHGQCCEPVSERDPRSGRDGFFHLRHQAEGRSSVSVRTRADGIAVFHIQHVTTGHGGSAFNGLAFHYQDVSQPELARPRLDRMHIIAEKGNEDRFSA